MIRNLIVILGLCGLAATAQASESSSADLTSTTVTSDTVYVDPPTGKEADRASILAALDRVPPGGTLQFAPGTYLVGAIISVTVPRLTLLGHSDGTTLRGCDPDRLGTREHAMANCNGLELAGARQTVRGLTFEYTYWALHLGCCQGERAMLRAPDGTLVEGPAIYRTEGGHLVEGNTFRRSASGIRMNGDWSEPAVVRGNRFVDNWHSVSINGKTVHLLDNDFSVPEPERVPFYGFPNDAVQIGAPLPFQGGEQTRARTCAHNVVAGNRIEGSHNGISIMLWAPGSSCRNNVIRENTITVRRARVPTPEWFTLVDESDSTFVGIPLSLLNYPEAFGQNESGQESAIEDNLIEGNRIIGAEGLGIEVLHASGNRIAGNTIRGIALRDPFPGNTMGPRGGDLEWREANGSGVWVSPGSDGNEIVGNTFEDIASHAIVLEGDRNRVVMRSESDTVRDLGRGNRVSAPGRTTDPADGSAVVSLRAQDAEVSRTRTLPGIDNPAFPYAEPEEVGLSSAKLNRLGDEITGWVANGDLVGAELLIVKDGRAVFHEAYGWSDREARKAVERNSIWSIKSMSKPFTATAILMLAEEGKLSLDDPVSRYISGFAGDERTTIHHLLVHTSGYTGTSRLGSPKYDYVTLKDAIEDWATEAPTRPFGEYSYSDFNYGALGYIVGVVSGVPIDTFTEEEIIRPLDLDDTSTAFSPDSSSVARLNPWYYWDRESGRYELRWSNARQPWPYYAAAWGLFSTAMDYAKFMAMWMNRGEQEGVRLISAETVEEALEPHALIDGNSFYGHGWFADADSGDKGIPSVFYHGGGDGTLALAFTDANAIVIFLTHSRAGPPHQAFRNRLSMLGSLGFPGFDMIWASEAGVDAVELSADDRARYVGMYRGQAPGGAGASEIVGRVWEEDGHLHSRFGEHGSMATRYFHLAPLGNDRFVHGRYRDDSLEAVEAGVTIRFHVEAGEAIGYDLLVNGQLGMSLERADPAQVRSDEKSDCGR